MVNINWQFFMYRSRLDLICLVIIVKASLMKVESGTGMGISDILEPLVSELLKLEEGVLLENGKKLYGTLITCTGDNLGIHILAGLKEGFTAHRPCRVCMVSETQRMTYVSEDPALLRTDSLWKSQLKSINDARTKKQKEELRTEYGIKWDSSASKLKSFSMTAGFPPDIVHDMLETGVVSVELNSVINHVLKTYSKDITLFCLNERLQDFDYGHAEVTDKPAAIKEKHLASDGHLRQKASQMWELATVLPFILAPIISKDDEHWDNFMLLLEICRMIFSPSIKKTTLPYLTGIA